MCVCVYKTGVADGGGQEHMGQLQRGRWEEKGAAGKAAAVQNLLGTGVTIEGAETCVLGKSFF